MDGQLLAPKAQDAHANSKLKREPSAGTQPAARVSTSADTVSMQAGSADTIPFQSATDSVARARAARREESLDEMLPEWRWPISARLLAQLAIGMAVTLTAMFVGLAVLGALGLGSVMLLVVAATGSAVAGVLYCYYNDALVVRTSQLDRRREEEKRILSNLTAEARLRRQSCEQLRTQYEQQRVDLELKRKEIETQGREKQQKLRTNLAEAQEVLKQRRDELNKLAVEALRQLTLDTQKKAAKFEKQLAKLDEQLDAQRGRLLEDLQREHVQHQLESHKVVDAGISGIGDKFCRRLEDCGVVTAADVSEERLLNVGGFGPQRIRTMLHWKETLENRARESAPQELDKAALEAYEQQWASQRKSLETEAYALEVRQSTRENALKGRFKDAREQLDKAAAKMQTKAHQKHVHLKSKYTEMFEETAQPLIASNTEMRKQYRAEMAALARTEAEMKDCRSRLADLDRLTDEDRAMTCWQYIRSLAEPANSGQEESQPDVIQMPRPEAAAQQRQAA